MDGWQLRYQLPSDPRLLVDLVDDVDVANMLEEWADYCRHPGHAGYKLRLLLQQVCMPLHTPGMWAHVGAQAQAQWCL